MRDYDRIELFENSPIITCKPKKVCVNADTGRTEKISSPILSKYDTAIILNQPSLEKFESRIKPGGILIYDGYGIINPPTRKDIKVYRIDAMDAANEMKNAKAFNMIVLGGLLKIAPIVTLDNVIKGLKKTLPERHHHLIPMNEEAIKRGMELIKEV